MSEPPFFIKVRKPGDKSWAFLAHGGTNRLRVHAAQFESREAAQRLIDSNAAYNPGWEWRIRDSKGEIA